MTYIIYWRCFLFRHLITRGYKKKSSKATPTPNWKQKQWDQNSSVYLSPIFHRTTAPCDRSVVWCYLVPEFYLLEQSQFLENMLVSRPVAPRVSPYRMAAGQCLRCLIVAILIFCQKELRLDGCLQYDLSQDQVGKALNYSWKGSKWWFWICQKLEMVQWCLWSFRKGSSAPQFSATGGEDLAEGRGDADEGERFDLAAAWEQNKSKKHRDRIIHQHWTNSGAERL